MPDRPVVAAPAATVLLVRDGASAMEVFMVVRHHEIDFAKGALVFPGGRVDASDAAPNLHARCLGHDGLDAERIAIRIAAIREVFEEAGLFLGRAASGAALNAASSDRLRARYQDGLNAGEIAFNDMVEAEDLALDIGALLPFAHWVTPPVAPKRFDTYFFIAAAPANQTARHDGGESVDSVWISPKEAVAESLAGTRNIVYPTRMNLEKLDREANVEGALARAAREEVVTVRPNLRRVEGGIHVKIPEGAGYAVTEFFIERPGGPKID